MINVHNFDLIDYAFLFVLRLTVFRKFHERRPLHWPNFSQSEYRWRTGGSKSFSCPCNNVRNLYYSHTHCSDNCFPLQEMGRCESNLNVSFCVYIILSLCVVLVVVKQILGMSVNLSLLTVYFRPISRLLHCSLQSVLMML